jgi:hypothetical protein
MNQVTKTPEQRETDHQEAVKTSYELCNQFINESVNFFVDESEIFDSIRSLRKMKFQWMNLETGNNQTAKNAILKDINNIVSLLIDISEGRARCTEAICNSFEHAGE